MLVFKLSLITLCSSLRLSTKIASRKNQSSENVTNSIGNITHPDNETVDILLKGKLEPVPMVEQLRHRSNRSFVWIMWFGDSNMRNTYHWWVTSQLHDGKRTESPQFGIDRHDLDFGGRWSDQEAVVEFPDGFEVRASFRFLHGSHHEFEYKTNDWHNASRAGTSEEIDATSNDVAFDMDDPNSVKPSKYAIWAAEHQSFIDFDEESPALAILLGKYRNVKPDAVILTEGWGGIPGCEHVSETVDMFKRHGDVKFVWAPVYVTNRNQERHDCFVNAVRALLGNPGNYTYSGLNFQIMDLWDLVDTLPVYQRSWKHIQTGGTYMTTACQRFETGILEDPH